MEGEGVVLTDRQIIGRISFLREKYRENIPSDVAEEVCQLTAVYMNRRLTAYEQGLLNSELYAGMSS